MPKNNLDSLISKLQEALSYLGSLHGKKVNPQDENMLLTPILHTDTEDMDKYESAKLELEHKEAFDMSRHITQEFHKRLE